ncbi:hypothetical protein B9J77_04930, partial [candidate division NPL-UPA2 bacterium Unc8]
KQRQKGKKAQRHRGTEAQRHRGTEFRKNEKGVALIAAVMVTAILAGVGISFAFNMRLEEKAAANYLWKTQADAIARGGIERTIRHITARRDEQFTHLGNYSIAVINEPLGGGLTARSEVTVRDEAGKVNLNTSGHGRVATAFSNHLANPGISRGWSTAEVTLPPIGITSTTWSRKFGRDGQPGVAGPGALGDDNRFLPGGITINPFGANSVLAHDRIDNDGDGVVDEPNEGVNEPSEFAFERGGRVTLDFAHVADDRPFITVGETGTPGVDLSIFTTLHSRDRRTDKDEWWRPGGTGGVGIGGTKTNINTASAAGLRDTLMATLGLSTADAARIAVNIIDFRDADSIPTTLDGKRGIERTLFINEIKMNRYWSLWRLQYMHEVRDFELHNPWPVAITGHYRVYWIDISGDRRRLLNETITIPARGFKKFHHDPPSNANPGGHMELWFRDAGWHQIEIVGLSPTNFDRHWSAKNDPRVPVFTYTGPNHSLGRVNDSPPLQDFRPTLSGEVTIPTYWAGHFNHFNRGFHNIGELGYIHTGGQWSTLRMRNVTPPGATTALAHQGAILSRVTIGHPYNRMGRININTAERSILTSLPQMEIQGVQAEGILQNRPFGTIGDAVPHLTAVVAGAAIDVRITQLMQWIQDVVNWAIHWPRTWGWPLRGVGRSLHNWMLDELIRSPIDNPPINVVINRNPADGRTYVNFFASPLSTSIVRGISLNVVNVTQSVITWARNNVPGWFGWRESLINRYLNPITRAAGTAYQFTLAGDDLDGDGFRGEDDELETIVRSVSNLITTRSDRFEIVSTGSVWRGGEKLAESGMRVIVCRISQPATILHFERR